MKITTIPGAPADGEVVIAVEASPINQYDLLTVAGGYGYRPQLPAIVGSEGVGRVVAVGAGVKHLKEGDRTLAPFLPPTWAERIKTDARWLRPLPPGDVNQFAMMGVNPPTAYFLLTDIVKLPHGSWIIQSGANSGVGRAIVAVAKSLGLKTINVVRREEVGAEMKALGANARGSKFRDVASVVRPGYGRSRAFSRHNSCRSAASAQHECAVRDGLFHNGLLRSELFDERSGESAQLLQGASCAR